MTVISCPADENFILSCTENILFEKSWLGIFTCKLLHFYYWQIDILLIKLKFGWNRIKFRHEIWKKKIKQKNIACRGSDKLLPLFLNSQTGAFTYIKQRRNIVFCECMIQIKSNNIIIRNSKTGVWSWVLCHLSCSKKNNYKVSSPSAFPANTTCTLEIDSILV